MLETTELARDAQWLSAAANLVLQNGLGAVALYGASWPRGSSRGGGAMHLPEEAELLRVFIGDSDRYHHKPLYEAIVEAARERHLAGATVLRGYLGYGAHSRIHSAKILRLSRGPAHRGRDRRRAGEDRGVPARSSTR